jgi:hypothetical protein
MSRIATTVSLTLLVIAAHAQNRIFQTRPIEHTLPSSQVAGMTYKLLVTLPPGYDREQRSYPVLYYLDAWMLGALCTILTASPACPGHRTHNNGRSVT